MAKKNNNKWLILALGLIILGLICYIICSKILANKKESANNSTEYESKETNLNNNDKSILNSIIGNYGFCLEMSCYGLEIAKENNNKYYYTFYIPHSGGFRRALITELKNISGNKYELTGYYPATDANSIFGENPEKEEKIPVDTSELSSNILIVNNKEYEKITTSSDEFYKSKQTTTNEIIKKVYKKGEEIVLSDNSKWLVLADSDENIDYVTVLSNKDFIEYFQETANDLNKELLFANTQYSDDWYNKSQTKKLLDSKINIIPAELKEVDGYKIRLIKVSEILAFDNNWEYDSERDTYYYRGNNFNQYFSGILTMTPSNCYGNSNAGKCAPLYNVGLVINSNPEEYFISHWKPGIGGLQPVINIVKPYIK